MRGKMIAVILLACVCAGPVLAQQKVVDFGIKGGINVANLTSDPEIKPEFENYLRPGGGATVGFPVAPGFALDVDFLYMQKGAKHGDIQAEVDQAVFKGDIMYRLDYFVINPMLRFAPITQGPTPFFVVGGEIGFLTSAKGVLDGTVNGQNIEDDRDIKDSFETVDFGLDFGAGLEIPAGNMAFTIEGRYALGLTDIAKDSADEEDEEHITIKTRGIYGFVGLRF
jgi:hypothetical protein